jgi:hypothetical protein
LPVPSRVIFRPPPGAGFADGVTAGTFNPLSPGSAVGAVVAPGVLGSPEGVLLVSGQGVVPVPAGTYQLFITRGPEYEAIEVPITLAPGQVQAVNAQLDRTVDTRGWLAADMHVHLNRSGDSALVADRRVISMVSNGVEIVVPTDHNVQTDLAPVALGLGYGPDLIGTVPGNEANFRHGHVGAFPVVFDNRKPAGGAPPWQPINPTTGNCDAPVVGLNCFAPVDAFAMLHASVPGTTVVSVTHPYWPDGDLGYFTNIGWGAGTVGGLGPLDTAGSFDALEVLNGYQTRADVEGYLVADWFYLLGQGYRVTALGNSDTHRINWVRAGWPRTWLRMPNDRPGDTTGATLADAVRHGRAIASTGPFITLTVDGAQIGDTVVPSRNQAVVGVTVDAPGWITVDTVRVYVNGVVVQTFQVPAAGQRPVFEVSFNQTLPRDGDAWIVAFASGQKALPDDVVGEYSHAGGYQMLPWAITNPVFIDGDGNGRWQPPASPATPGGFGLERLRPVAARAAPVEVPVECDPGLPEPIEPLLPAERELMPLLDP